MSYNLIMLVYACIYRVGFLWCRVSSEFSWITGCSLKMHHYYHLSCMHDLHDLWNRYCHYHCSQINQAIARFDYFIINCPKPFDLLAKIGCIYLINGSRGCGGCRLKAQLWVYFLHVLCQRVTECSDCSLLWTVVREMQSITEYIG